MPLPGKLCLGILEEDNPQKSYFRFKPLLIEKDGRYVPFEAQDAYPEDGCIRIVPDKNESSHFKIRMRRVGLYAVVDLREHPGDNDKIRLNKNYHGDESERNVHIIYSDVVRKPAAGTVFSLLALSEEQAREAVLTEAPGAAFVLLCSEGAPVGGVWEVKADEGGTETFRLVKADMEVDVGELQHFEIPGFRETPLRFAVLPPSKVEQVAEPQPVKPSKAAEPEKKEPAAPVEIEKKGEEAEVPERPWLNREEARPLPTPEFGRHGLAGQTGLNPRRGRSLQEIIDEKWRHSRMDQLGALTPSLVTDAPAVSPLESALGAVRKIWEDPQQRSELVQGFVGLEGMEDALNARRAAVRQSAVNEQLNELEAQRLKMLADMERLRRMDKDVRAELKEEIRRDEADAFVDAVSRTERAKAEQARAEEEAARIRTASDAARDALNALVDGQFEQRLWQFAIDSHAVELLRRMDAGRTVATPVNGEDVDAETLVERVIATFDAAGCPLEWDDAVNLLVCAAQGAVLLVAGAPGSGKTTAVRLLARALGIENVRYAEFAPEGKALSVEELGLTPGDAPALVLLDDVNLAPHAGVCRGLIPAAERGQFLLCATLQDDGAPVPSHLFGRAFTVRLPELPAERAWQMRATRDLPAWNPVSAESLRKAFGVGRAPVPEAQVCRLEALRAGLALLNVRLSGKTMDAMWNYCSVAMSLMRAKPDLVLDRALAQCALPAILAGAPLSALAALPNLLEGLPRCQALLKEPWPVAL